MTHEVRMWVVPLVAAILGLLLFATSKDKWATIGATFSSADFSFCFGSARPAV